jgi:hypothetical protein
MTTIGPQKKPQAFKIYMFSFFSVFTAGAVISLFLYSSIVNLKHTIRDAEKKSAELLVQNTETKNELYELLDSERLEAVARDLGYVIEKNPAYLELSADALATTL